MIGHISQAVLSDYVHLSQTTIAERAGRASLAEMLGAAPAAPADGAAIGLENVEALISAVRKDPQLRKALLSALLAS
jgi:hypothetical protein